MNHLIFTIKNSFEEALTELLERGLRDHYVLCDDSGAETSLGGSGRPEDFSGLAYSILDKVEPLDVSWTEQWAEHSPHFDKDLLRIDLSLYGGPSQELLLHPGPGFGDLSHPTTRLMLKMMAQTDFRGKKAIDIGCGSGVLALAALHLGADEALAIDVDPLALAHTERNAQLNGLGSRLQTHATVPLFDPNESIVLINMTLAEQSSILGSLPPCLMLASGILKYQKTSFLSKIPSSTLLKKASEKEWLSFIVSH